MKKYFWLPAILVFAIASCKKEDMGANSASNTDFPNAVGNHWRYKYTISGLLTDYIDVDVVGQGTLPDGQKANIWVSRIQSFNDTSYVVSNGGIVKVYNKPCWVCTKPMPYERMRYVLPLQTGNSWFTNAFYGDTTKVLGQSILAVPAGTFANTYELSKTRGYVTNSRTNNRVWVTPGVGITKLNQVELSLGGVTGNGLWELDSYSLK